MFHDTTNMKQVGVIVWGGGLNRVEWEREAKQQGYVLINMGAWTELYR